MQAAHGLTSLMAIHDSPDSGSPHSGVVKRTSPGSSEYGPLVEGEGKFGRRYKVSMPTCYEAPLGSLYPVLSLNVCHKK